jgi:TolB-like protein/Tfp pilus assembly protein PilF
MAIALIYFIYESRFQSPTASVLPTEQAEVIAQASIKVNANNPLISEPKGTSIAVLPFVNMSSDKEQEYFSDGISEEILNVLAKIPKLQVTSRSSAFAYKDTKINISEVAKILGVKNVLEGSVRKSGVRVRITAQLINADTDKHLWSESYDRELDDIFQVQDEISAEIVDALNETLGISLVKTVSSAQTINPKAYDLYLQGLRGLHTYTFGSLDNAAAALELATDIAPEFLMARIKLAETYARQIITGSRFDWLILDKAETLIKEVLSINLNSAEAYFVRSLIIKTDRKLRNQYAKEAYWLNPNNVDIIIRHAQSNAAEMGEDNARALFKRAQKVDPLNADLPYFFAVYLVQKYSEAEQTLKQAIKVNPKNTFYPFYLGQIYAQHMGQIVDAIKLAENGARLDPNDPYFPQALSIYYLSLGSGVKSLEYAEKAMSINANNAEIINQKVNSLICFGQTAKALILINDTVADANTVYPSKQLKERFITGAVYLLLKQKKFDDAEALINLHIPGINEWVNQSPPATLNAIENVNGILLLARVYKAQGQLAKVEKLVERVKGRDESFYLTGQARLLGIEYMNLAISSSLENNDEQTIKYLEAAIDNGYLYNWRANL